MMPALETMSLLPALPLGCLVRSTCGAGTKQVAATMGVQTWVCQALHTLFKDCVVRRLAQRRREEAGSCNAWACRVLGFRGRVAMLMLGHAGTECLHNAVSYRPQTEVCCMWCRAESGCMRGYPTPYPSWQQRPGMQALGALT